MMPLGSYTEDPFSFCNAAVEYPQGTVTAPEITSVTPETVTYDGLEPGATSVGVPWDFINFPGGMQVMVLTGDGNASNILTIYPPNTVTAPSDLGVTVNGDGTYTFAWTGSPSGTTNRIVDIGASTRGDAVAGDLMYEGNYVANGSPVDPASVYTDSGASSGVYAMSADNSSGYGMSSTILDLANPGAPTNIAATALGAAGIGVTWTDNAFNESGYTIQRSSDGGSTWTTLSSSLAADTEYYQDTTAVAGTSYQYRVNSNRTNALGAVSSVWDPTGAGVAIPLAAHNTGARYRIDVVTAPPATIAAGGTVTFTVKVWDTSIGAYTSAVAPIGIPSAGLLNVSVGPVAGVTYTVTVTSLGSATTGKHLSAMVQMPIDRAAITIEDLLGTK